MDKLHIRMKGKQLNSAFSARYLASMHCSCRYNLVFFCWWDTIVGTRAVKVGLSRGELGAEPCGVCKGVLRWPDTLGSVINKFKLGVCEGRGERREDLCEEEMRHGYYPATNPSAVSGYNYPSYPYRAFVPLRTKYGTQTIG